MVGFQKQNLQVQKNMNSESPRVLRKNWFYRRKSVDEVIYHVWIQTPQGLLDLSEVSKTFCFWQLKVLKTFQTYHTRSEKEKSTKNGIGLK